MKLVKRLMIMFIAAGCSNPDLEDPCAVDDYLEEAYDPLEEMYDEHCHEHLH